MVTVLSCTLFRLSLNSGFGLWGGFGQLAHVPLPLGRFIGPAGFFVKPHEALGGLFQARFIGYGGSGLAVAQAVVTGDQQWFGFRVLLNPVRVSGHIDGRVRGGVEWSVAAVAPSVHLRQTRHREQQRWEQKRAAQESFCATPAGRLDYRSLHRFSLVIVRIGRPGLAFWRGAVAVEVLIHRLYAGGLEILRGIAT